MSFYLYDSLLVSSCEVHKNDAQIAARQCDILTRMFFSSNTFISEDFQGSFLT